MAAPVLLLNGNHLPFFDRYKYLGVFIHNDLSDESDIKRHIRSLYCRGNVFTKNFKSCNTIIKNRLFVTYCSNAYGATLWCNFPKPVFNKAIVAYNDIYRQLFGIRRGISMTATYAENKLLSFKDVVLSNIVSFRKRINRSHNMILYAITRSVFFINDSSINKFWKNPFE